MKLNDTVGRRERHLPLVGRRTIGRAPRLRNLIGYAASPAPSTIGKKSQNYILTFDQPRVERDWQERQFARNSEYYKNVHVRLCK
jgi:hypothetical protein